MFIQTQRKAIAGPLPRNVQIEKIGVPWVGSTGFVQPSCDKLIKTTRHVSTIKFQVMTGKPLKDGSKGEAAEHLYGVVHRLRRKLRPKVPLFRHPTLHYETPRRRNKSHKDRTPTHLGTHESQKLVSGKTTQPLSPPQTSRSALSQAAFSKLRSPCCASQQGQLG